MAELFVWSLIGHLVCDWLLQTDWMAANKGSLAHPASWVHGAIHAAALALVFPAPVAAGVGLAHVLIDTRRPLQWWRAVSRARGVGPMGIHVAIWQDQVLHIALLAVAAQLSVA